MILLYALLHLFFTFIKRGICFIGLHSWVTGKSYLHWKCEVCGKEKIDSYN